MPPPAAGRPSRAGAECRHSRVIAWALDRPWCGLLEWHTIARLRSRLRSEPRAEASVLMSQPPVQRPAGAVRAFEIVVGLGRIGHAPGGRIVGDLLADAVRHQAEQHLLHHGSGVIEIAVRLTAGAVGDAVALAFASVEPFRLEDVAARRTDCAGLFGCQYVLHVGIRQAQVGRNAAFEHLHHREAGGGYFRARVGGETGRQRTAAALAATAAALTTAPTLA